jgi:hypothetical protein
MHELCSLQPSENFSHPTYLSLAFSDSQPQHHGIGVMGHSCIQCQKYVIVQPRFDEEAHWVDVLQVEHQDVAAAASDGCAFFAWCLSQAPEPSTSLQGQEPRAELRFRAYMYAGRSSAVLAGRRFLALLWGTAPGFKEGKGVYIKSLFLMVEVGEYLCLRGLPKVSKSCKVILQHATSQHGPYGRVWHRMQVLSLAVNGWILVIERILLVRLFTKPPSRCGWSK